MKRDRSVGLVVALVVMTLLPAGVFPAEPAAVASPKPAPADAPAGVRLRVEPAGELSPTATLEVVFPTPMIVRERIGERDAVAPLQVEPEWAGSFHWVSTRSGHFKPAQPAKLATRYRFFLRPGLRDAAGRAVPEQTLATIPAPPFRIVGKWPGGPGREQIDRQPRLVLQFNDPVEVAAAAQHLRFVANAPSLTMIARVRHAFGRELRGYRLLQPTWAEQAAGAQPVLADDEARLSALVVEPESPLTVADGWRLEIGAELANASGEATLGAPEQLLLGAVRSLAVRSVRARTPFDAPRQLEIEFNKSLLPPGGALSPELRRTLAERALARVRLEPPVPGLRAEIDGGALHLHGDFALAQPYRLHLEPGLLAGDGLTLATEAALEAIFQPNPPYIGAPAFVSAQLAAGAGEFELAVANVREVRVRAKRFNGPELLQALEMYAPYASEVARRSVRPKPFQPPPLDDYPGTVIFERVFAVSKPLDRSEILRLNWREMLGTAEGAPLLVECEGYAAPGVAPEGTRTQSLVQFTDLGLMQKSSGRDNLVFVTSLRTGQPLAGVRLTAVDAQRRLMAHAETDSQGVAVLTGAPPAFVLAEKAGDCAALRCEEANLQAVIPYDIPRAWRNVWKPQMQAFVFSDRPLYRPGETAHVKVLARQRLADELRLPGTARQASLTLRDPRYRIVLEKSITFTDQGSWTGDLTLPEGPLGRYELSLRFGDDQEVSNGSYAFRIEDYRPNTFEIRLDPAGLERLPDRLKLPLSASYFMGKPLSRATVAWSASATRGYEPPAGFQDYHFGAEPPWLRYGQNDGAGGRDADDMAQGEWWAHGEVQLDAQGRALLDLPQPPPDQAALPQQVEVTVEITDINQQTISSTTEFTLPGASLLLGLRQSSPFGRAGQEMDLELAAITPQGDPAAAPVSVEVRVERQEHHTLREATAGGGSTTREQVTLHEELRQTLNLSPAASATAGTIRFTPATGGLYFVTVTAADAGGRRVFSRLPVHVLGGNEFPWAAEDGARIRLEPLQARCKPGEEAVIAVKTPIAGTALVSVERNRLHRHFVTRITPDQPLIRVPISEDEAPNVFVSVLLVRGSADSPKPHAMPEYRIGYCELEVESHAKELKVALMPARAEVRPGETLEVTGIVTDAQGRPVAGGEVTLFAVDEGVLSLVKHATPAPEAVFHASQPLGIESFISLSDLLPEDPRQRLRGNKGFLIGDGGDGADAPVQVRKKFAATPLWQPTLTTDAQGRVRARLTAPDNLTRYRLMAVATSGADRFGHGESGFAVNKPLMIEPVLPRFARLGDEVLVKAVIHNTTAQAGDVEVRLELDGTAEFIRDGRVFVAGKIPAATEPRLCVHTLPVQAGETAVLALPVRFTALGAARWTWSAKPVTWPAGAAVAGDAAESALEVEHPLPELREVRYARLEAATSPAVNLAAEVSPALLEGQGRAELRMHVSRLGEVRDALAYILRYPYGCLEQTTSSTLPWLALRGHEAMFPDLLDGGRAGNAVQAGVNRILGMTTQQGGLSYWAGGSGPSLWGSSYAGLLLLRARQSGAHVPDSVLNELLNYLSGSLRGLDQLADGEALTDRAFALYTLAEGGRAEPAYQNRLHAQRERLPESARLYTALAMCLTKAPAAQVRDLLAEDRRPVTPQAWSWLGNSVTPALRLLVFTHLGLRQEAEAQAQRLLDLRNERGEWGNTFANAWALTALAACEGRDNLPVTPLAARVRWGAGEQVVNLAPPQFSALWTAVLDAGLAAAPLRVQLPPNQKLYSRLEVRAFPPNREFSGESKGCSIERSYAELQDDGALTGIDDLRVGDLVVVTLKMRLDGAQRYLAVEDPLPSVLEALNPSLATQRPPEGGREPLRAWFFDHHELRADRALFFTNAWSQEGRFQLRYLARVIAEGDTVAPPARIEAMYAPHIHGLSASQRLKTLPSGTGQVAGP